MIEADSDCVGQLRQAANHDERKLPVDMLVMHYTGIKSQEAALDLLCGAEGRVSCHYLVGEDGHIVQMVGEGQRAWHAGISSWRGIDDNNSRSIGIEIVNPGHEHGYRGFPEKQIAALIELSLDIIIRNAIEPRNVVAHSDIAPMRKSDPGELFPWNQLHEAGIGRWVEPQSISGGRFLQRGDEGEPVAAFQAMLALYGYGVDTNARFDDLTAACVMAFQRHFRQEQVDGVADTSTVATLHKLLKALPDVE